MNTELKNQNKELREHNTYLRSAENKSEQPFPQINFSDIVAAGANTKKLQETVQLIVKPNEKFKGNILQVVQNEITKNRNTKVLNIRLDKDKVLDKCFNKHESEVVCNTLQRNGDSN